MIINGFSKNLKYFRKLTGFNQEKMAEELGISYSYYSKIESTDEIPSIEVLLNICNYFKIPCDFLIKDSGYRNFEEYANNYMINELKKLPSDVLSNVTDSLTFLFVNLCGKDHIKKVLESKNKDTTQ